MEPIHYEQHQENHLLVSGIPVECTNQARALGMSWHDLLDAFLKEGVVALKKMLDDLTQEQKDEAATA